MTPVTAMADQLADCEKLVQLADEAIQQQSKTIELLSDQRERMGLVIDEQVALNARLNRERNAWYRQPSIVVPMSVLLGFIAGSAWNKR